MIEVSVWYILKMWPSILFTKLPLFYISDRAWHVYMNRAWWEQEKSLNDKVVKTNCSFRFLLLFLVQYLLHLYFNMWLEPPLKFVFYDTVHIWWSSRRIRCEKNCVGSLFAQSAYKSSSISINSIVRVNATFRTLTLCTAESLIFWEKHFRPQCFSAL